MMRPYILGCGTALLIAMSASAQNLPPPPDAATTQPAQPAQAPEPQPMPPAGAQTVYAMKTANIRAGAGTTYNVIGKAEAGQPLQVTGPVPGNPEWLQVAAGGFIAQSVTSPTPVAVVHHHHHSQPEQPVVDNYPVGSCQPYTRVINIAGQPPQQVNGTACKGPDGAWKMQGNGMPVPVPAPAPPPVIVQPRPVYVAPAPVYAQPVPVYPQPVPVYPQPVYR